MASAIYVSILQNQSDNNVTLIILDKLLTLVHKTKSFLQSNIVDLCSILSCQSLEIRERTLCKISTFLIWISKF